MGKITKKKSNDIHSARGRLKGALQVLVNASDEDESENESSDKKSSSMQGRSRSSRGRPPKKISKSDSPPPVLKTVVTTATDTTSNTTTTTATTSTATTTTTTSSNSKSSESKQGNSTLQESFVMKLFDRSLDLAKYDEHTPLYPICRAWLLNQPRSTAIKSFKNRRSPSPIVREKNKDIWKKVLSGSNIDIDSLPAPKSLKIPRAPSPLNEQKEAAKENVDIDYDIDSPNISKENLLDSHKKRWVKIRNKWNAHLKARQQRYVVSNEILEAIYRPIQQ